MLINSESQQRARLFSWGHWFTTINVFLGLVVSSIYIFSSPAPEGFIAGVYLILYWLGHIGFLFFIGYILAVFPVVSLFTQIGFIRIWTATIATSGLTLMFVDSLVYSAYGYHLDLLSTDNIKNDLNLLLANIPSGFMAAFIVLFAAIFSIQIALSNKLWRSLEEIRRILKIARILPAFISFFVIGHLIHMWADAKLYRPILKQDNLFPLSYPLKAKGFLEQSGLLDISEYKHKKRLSFDFSAYQLNLPTTDLSCQLPRKKMSLTFIEVTQSELATYNEIINKALPQSVSAPHWSAFKGENVLFEATHALPLIYQQIMAQTKPLLELALQQTHPVKPKLAIRYWPLAADQNRHLKAIKLMPNDQQHMIVLLPTEKASIGRLYLYQPNVTPQALASDSMALMNSNQSDLPMTLSNPLTLPNLTSNFDIAPTLINGWLNCNADEQSINFGQNLLGNSATVKNNVTADGSFIYVWNDRGLNKIDQDANTDFIPFSPLQGNENPAALAELIRAVSKLKRYLIKK